MGDRRIRILSSFSLLVAVAVPVSGLPATVSVEAARDGVETVVRVTSGPRPVELRRTSARVTGLRSGTDPKATAAFTIWNEGSIRWGAVSRDGGVTWSRSRPIKNGLGLRDALVRPGDPMPPAVVGLSASPDSRLRIVQFRTVSLPEWRAALKDFGIEILAHVPHNAHIVRTDPSLVQTVAGLDFVERVEPYHASYRVEANLRSDLTKENGFPVEERIRVAVFEWGVAAKQRVLSAAIALGARVASNWPSGHVLELWAGAEAIRVLAAHDDVMWIERWTEPGFDMDNVREDAGTNWVHDNFGYCGQGVAGEVMDNGVQDDHPDFDGIVLHGPTDIGSHGTSTYGIVFGNGDLDGDGDGKALGHLPCSQGIFANAGEFTDRFAHTEELKQAPYFASFQTNSWGSSLTQDYTTASQEMDDIVWRLDIAILNSQSNNGNQTSRPEAWAKNVIGVGGIRHYDTLDTSDDAWAGGASIGPAADGRIKPDVSYWYDAIYTTTSDSGYTSSFGGTSAATPGSAGVLGLIVEMWADNVWATNPAGTTPFEKQPHFSTLKALLINSAQQYAFSGAGSDLGRFKQGWGRPNARSAYERAAKSFIVDESDLLQLNDITTYLIDVEPGETELKITLVYPDPPGTTSASMHRINDVDLRVTSPSMTLYHGNAGLEDGTESTTGGAPDTLNTVENVFIANPQAGQWTVEIEAAEVNQDAHLATVEDDLAYALVVTGGREVYTSGQAQLDSRPDAVACTDTIELTVRDGNVGASIDVTVFSDSEAPPETISLPQTGSGSGIYTGQVAVVSTAPGVDGAVSVADGDTVTVEYIDADDGSGGSDILLQRTVSVDCAAPQISNVRISDLTDTEATVSWTTDEPSNSAAGWGTVIPPDLSDTRAAHATVHHLRLKGLTECTSYFYSVGSEDPLGNLATDDNGGAYHAFTTLTNAGGQLHDCGEGTLILEADTVGCTSGVPISLGDAGLNLDPGVAETAEVYLSSTTELTPEPVTLTESGLNTGIFTGLLPTGTGAAVADGVLQTSDGDWVTGTYFDEDNGAGGSKLSVDTVDVDCAGPVVSSIAVSNRTDWSATVSWLTSEDATSDLEWGSTPALGSIDTSLGFDTDHSVTADGFTACDRVYFRVVATDAYGNVSTADVGGTPFEFNALNVPGVLHVDDFETDTGWALSGEWEIGPPMGLGSGAGDPDEAVSGTRILGHDLSGQGVWPGDFEPLSDESAISPMIDGTSFANTEIKFRKKLNVTNGSFAYIDVKDSSGSWNPVYQTLVSGQADADWTDTVLDISALADNNPNLQIRFREASFIPGSFAAGWNIDDLTLRDGSLPLLEDCGNCAGTPTFAGLVSAVDDDPCADSGVTLSWQPAASWGTGGVGTYAIYRDTVPGFTPRPSNLIASGVSTTQWTDTLAPDDTDLYYIVFAENDENCSDGPANGGVLDGNTVYLTGRDDTVRAVRPDEVTPLVVDTVNGAHARLTWPATLGAEAYRVYRSGQPDVNFTLQSETSGELFDDLDVLVDGQLWFYRVVGVDACGGEGP